jgi:ubiquinone/menaquinone biosynthesis C-methylase UbiE
MDFDCHADNYLEAVRQAAGVCVENLAAEKARMILNVLANCVGNPKQLQVLDIGCGIGLIDRELNGSLAKLYGVDTSLRSLEIARTMAPMTCLVHYDGVRLPFLDSSFDAVFASCVLHHVPPSMQPSFMLEMLRPLRSGGVVILIEHNPLNPVTRRAVSRCAFDADAVLLWSSDTNRLIAEAGARVIGRRYVGFWPYRNTLVEWIENMIAWLPIGAQYCVWGIKTQQAMNYRRTLPNCPSDVVCLR